MSQDKLYFKNLDAIRFIAVIMVVSQHTLLNAFRRLEVSNGALRRFLYMLADGGSGVSVFFVLSGFLITYILILEHEVTGTISLANFYTRRILRIWPLFFAVIAYSFLIYPGFKTIIGMNSPLPSELIYHLTFLSNFDVIDISKHFPGLNAMSQDITWSVSIEEQFYVIWPLIFLFLPKQTWIAGILFFVLSSIVFRILHDADEVVLYFHTLSNFLDLATGSFFAWLVFKSKGAKVFFQQSGSGVHLWSFVLVFVLLFFKGDISTIKYGTTIFKIVSTLGFGFIISCQALTMTDSRWVFSKLRFATKWGKYTYGMYMLHPIPLTLLLVAYRLLHIDQESFVPVLVIAFLVLVVTMLLSWFSYTYFESIFLKLKPRFTRIPTAR